MDNNYYVYLHLRQSDNKIFYVGKGKGRRAYTKDSRNTYWHNVANKHGVYILIYKDKLTENEAFDLEIKLIKKYKKQLVNLTDGGEGMSGYEYSEETRKNFSDRYYRMMEEGFHPRTNTKEYVFFNKDGRFFIGTTKDFSETYNIKMCTVRLMIKKVNHLMKTGWYLKEADLNKSGMAKGDRHKKTDNEVYTFIHENGTIENLKRFEMISKYDYITHVNIHSLISGKVSQLFGWHIKGRKVKNRKDLKLGSNNPMYGKKGKDSHRTNKTIKTIIKEDLIFTGTWFEFADKYNINRKHASNFFAGRKKSCYGWTIKE